MIVVQTTYQQEDIHSLTISGHAESAEKGKDLVCAGVSCIATGLLNALDILTPHDCVLSLQANRVSVQVTKITHDSQLILRAALIQIDTMREQYGDYLTVKKTEV